MSGQGLETILVWRIERLRQRVEKVEDWIMSSRSRLRTDPPSSTDLISTASRMLGLLYALGKFLVWSGPYLVMAGLMLWGWLKRSVLGWP